MSQVVEIIKSFLTKPHIKKILIAEDHFDYTPKEALIDLFDQIEQGTFICKRKLILVLEHISIKEQMIIDEAVKNKKSTSDLVDIFKKCPFVDPQNLKINMYVELVKKAILMGIAIKATENQATGYSSMIRSTCINRIRTANAVFEDVFDDEIFSPDEVVAIFLGGAAHIVDMHPNRKLEKRVDSITGLKTALNEQGDTVSLFIYDEGGNCLNRNPKNELPHIAIEGFYGTNNFDVSVCVPPQKKLLENKTIQSSNCSTPDLNIVNNSLQ